MKISFRPHMMILAATLVAGCGERPGRGGGSAGDAPTIKVGHVGHDHHTALFVAADNAERFAARTGILLKVVRDRSLYELFDGKRKLADVEVVLVGGGSKMPTALSQGVIDLGFGGVVPVLAAADKGAPVRLIAPLHSRGDMLVVRPETSAGNWDEFLQYVRSSTEPVRIGYKDPNAVAKLVFEEALRHEGVSFTDDPSRQDAQVHMINVKGGGKLNIALAGGLVDGYVGNNPFPAMGLEKGMLRIVADLEDLPPGTLRDHPCCCIAANCGALQTKKEAITALLVLFLQATELINTDLDAAVASATRWTGTSREVELKSIPTSGYSMDPTPEWKERMAVWLKTMQALKVFDGKLGSATANEAGALVYDMSLLKDAMLRFEE